MGGADRKVAARFCFPSIRLLPGRGLWKHSLGAFICYWSKTQGSLLKPWYLVLL